MRFRRALALAALALAGCGSGGVPAGPEPVPDTTPPALTGYTPAPGQAVKQPFEVTATFDEAVAIDGAWFRSDLDEHAVAAAAGATGREVVVEMPLVDAFGSRVRLDVRDAAGNAAGLWVGDWYAEPIWLEFIEPSLVGPLSGVVQLRVNWAGPALLPVSIDDTPLGVLTYGARLDVDTTTLADGPHVFWFHAPGYQRTPMAFEVDNTP
jgi:hypothetical protein